MAGMYKKKHGSIDSSAVQNSTVVTLRWRSDSYQVNSLKEKQPNNGPVEPRAVELTKLSYPHDSQILQNLQGTVAFHKRTFQVLLIGKCVLFCVLVC